MAATLRAYVVNIIAGTQATPICGPNDRRLVLLVINSSGDQINLTGGGQSSSTGVAPLANGSTFTLDQEYSGKDGAKLRAASVGLSGAPNAGAAVSLHVIEVLDQ